MGIVWSDMNKRSRGGTELMMSRLEDSMPIALLDRFQIVASRMTEPLDPTRIRILWLHDTADDPEVAHLASGGWRKFHRLVFVSNQQQQEFIRKFGIPWSRCMVIQNAIEPIERPYQPRGEWDGKVRLVYTSTPHRGLNVLVAAFSELARRRDDVHLDVFSSFATYGWGDRDSAFEELFQACRDHPNVTYHGSAPNDVVRETLAGSHVFAYPSTYQETSCLCLMEAMSADLVCVHPNLGALYETAAGLTLMYPFHEDLNHHAGAFFQALSAGVDIARRRLEGEGWPESSQKGYADSRYSWKNRSVQWRAFLESLLELPTEIDDPSDTFTYSIG